MADLLRGRKRSEFIKQIIATVDTLNERYEIEIAEIEKYILDPLCVNNIVRMSDTVWINKNGRNKRVDPRKAKLLEKDGWMCGQLSINSLRKKA